MSFVNDSYVRSAYNLRDFISERLTAAAEEIFSVFEQTVAQYEEEIERQRRLLDVCRKPESAEILSFTEEKLDHQHKRVNDSCKQKRKLDKKELQQQHFYDKGDVSTTQKHHGHINPQCLNPNEQELLQRKAEQVEPWPTQVVEHLGLKQVSDGLMGPVRNGGNQQAEQLLCESIPGTENQGHERNKRFHSRSSTYTEGIPTPSTSDGLVKLVRCDFCGNGFRDNYQMQIHMRTHTGEKPYSCEICGKRYSRNNTLTVHMRIHTGEKPYGCKLCGKSYRKSGDLTGHMRTHTGEKPHRCSTCGKRFYRLSHLTCHMRTHTGDKPYICNTCGKMYSQRSALKKHLKVHILERP